jgi:methylenetetrahydrofolate dehydrogenase (NADP+)/methenyltetrahydrofolate cyclohydrolase
VITAILPEKDVDGFHPVNVGRLSLGLSPYATPCTPLGVMELLAHHHIKLEGQHAVIIGRSNIVGKPMAQLLLSKNATVTIAHSKTNDLQSLCQQADIIVAAVGIEKLVKANWVKPKAVVVDVGINRNAEGKLVGDVDFEAVKAIASVITPVPGGVGPMTVACLMSNTFSLFQNSLGQKPA